MTISGRNNLLRAGILSAFALLVLVVLASTKFYSWYHQMVLLAENRPHGLFQSVAARFLRPEPWVPAATVGGSILFALAGLVLILHYFEKTQAPEIVFVSFFVFSLALESCRLALPLARAWNLPGIIGIAAQRILLFGRYGGIFSLFAAGICAAGLDMQRQGTIVLSIILVSLVIALNVPLDSLVWDTSFCLESGYNSMFFLAETGVGLIGSLSFLVSAHSRGSREYIAAGVGAFLAFLGRGIFLRADTWATPLPGLVLLAAGTWLVCAQLHRVYLWL